MNAKLRHLLDLAHNLPKYATTELLRAAKRKGGVVKIGAATSSELRKNLSEAVSNGSVSIDDLQQLVAEYEENGDQHVFFYQIDQRAVLNRILDFKKASVDLLGENWESRYQFPLYQQPTTALEWIDIRKGSSPDEVWVAKMLEISKKCKAQIYINKILSYVNIELFLLLKLFEMEYLKFASVAMGIPHLKQ